jgi:hypothetical protein
MVHALRLPSALEAFTGTMEHFPYCVSRFCLPSSGLAIVFLHGIKAQAVDGGTMVV